MDDDVEDPRWNLIEQKIKGGKNTEEKAIPTMIPAQHEHRHKRLHENLAA